MPNQPPNQMPYPMPRQPLMYGDHWHDGGAWPVIGHIAWLLVLVAIVALVAVVVLRLTQGRVAAPSVASPHDPALAELRLRYARGEMSREEYLVRLGDLHPGAVFASAGTPPPVG
jgi:putative membrane protein